MHPEIYYFSSLNKAEIRALILHLLYSVETNDYLVSVDSVLIGYRDFGLFFENNSEQESIVKKIEKIIEKKDILDQTLIPFFKNWKIERLSTLVLLILRYSCYEMIFENVDSALVINEAVELAKNYAEEDSYKFINGVLDALAKSIAKTENVSIV